MKIIYATNINSGGGQVLLEAALIQKYFGQITRAYVDSRCAIDFKVFQNLEVIKVKPNILSRYMAQKDLQKFCKQYSVDQVVFFGNLPPFLKIKSKISIFFQNAYLLKSSPLPKNIKLKIRTIFERLLFYFFIDKKMKLMVQTPWMQTKLQEESKLSSTLVHLLPDFPEIVSNDKQFDLIAITGPESHKNQDLLIHFLKGSNQHFSICLISPSNISIENRSIHISHYKKVKRNDLFQLLSKSRALIVLSSFESLCLPLYEAKHFGLKLISPIKGYITDNIFPDFPIKELNTKEINKSVEGYLKNVKRG